VIRLDPIKKQLEKHPGVKAVSLDVFDTLLDRLLPSSRVSQLAAEYLAARMPYPTDPGDILRSRMAYQQARESAGQEWTVAEWLAEWANHNGHEPALVHLAGQQAELAAERSALTLADETQEAFSWLRAQNIMLIALSDMWLENDWLEELLRHFDLQFNAVFSSGSLQASKRQGTIFRLIEHRFALPLSSFLHIGDNINNDLLKPRRAGWKALWLPQKRHRFPPKVPLRLQRGPLKPSGASEILRILELEPMDKSHDIFVRIGRDHLTPLLILFSIVQWRIFRKRKIDAALYIARDAWLMLQVYDMIADLLPGSCPRHYLSVSRRSVALSHPDDLLSNVLPIAGKVGRKTVGQWLGNFTISEQLRKALLQRAGLSEYSPFHEPEREQLRRACRGMHPAIQVERANHRELLRDLIDQTVGNAGIPALRNIGIVDSGWAGTTQDVIRTVLPEVDTISGVYLGVSKQGRSPTKGSNKYGLLRDDYRAVRHHNVLQGTAGVLRVWDCLLRQNAGSVIELERTPDDHVQPVADAIKLSCNDRLAIEAIERGVTQGVQDRSRAVEALVRFSDCWSGEEFEIAAGKLAGKITIRPSRETAAAILSLGFDEGTAQGELSSLGLEGVRKGVAWYPGLLSLAYLGEGNRMLGMMAAIPGQLSARHRP
jgi:FMN phosphatase YigB (HAD superfamily)